MFVLSGDTGIHVHLTQNPPQLYCVHIMKPYTPERVTDEQQNNRLKYLIIHSNESFLTKDTKAVWYLQVPRCFFISAFLSRFFCHYTCSHSRSAKFCAHELSENKYECNCGICVTHDLQNALFHFYTVYPFVALIILELSMQRNSQNPLASPSARIYIVCHHTWKALLFQYICKRLGFKDS